MKPLRHVLVVAIVCAVAAAVTTGAQEPRPTRAAPADPDARRSGSLREFAQRLAAENVRLKAANESLLADNATLRRQVEESQKALQRLRGQGGILVVPPDGRRVPGVPAPGGVPPEWRPFNFNGTTYYIVPLSARPSAATGVPAAGATKDRR